MAVARPCLRDQHGRDCLWPPSQTVSRPTWPHVQALTAGPQEQRASGPAQGSLRVGTNTAAPRALHSPCTEPPKEHPQGGKPIPRHAEQQPFLDLVHFEKDLRRLLAQQVLMDTQVAEPKPSPCVLAACWHRAHSPVTDQGREVRGELFVTCGHRWGPGSESGEALARVNTAKALQEERHRASEVIRGWGADPCGTPLPSSVPCPAPPCWRSWPGSAASPTVCPSQKMWGAGRRRHLSSGWRRGARRRPVRDTKVVVGASSSGQGLPASRLDRAQGVNSDVQTRTPARDKLHPRVPCGAATLGPHPTAAEGSGEGAQAELRAGPRGDSAPLPPQPCLRTADLVPTQLTGASDSGLLLQSCLDGEGGAQRAGSLAKCGAFHWGGSPRAPEFWVLPSRTDNLLSAGVAVWQDPRRKVGQPSSACPRLQDRGHTHFLLTPRKAASSLPGAAGCASAGCGGQRGFQHGCQDDTRPHPDGTGSQGGRGLCLKKRSRLWKTDSARAQGSCAGAARSQQPPAGGRGPTRQHAAALAGLASGESSTGGRSAGSRRALEGRPLMVGRGEGLLPPPEHLEKTLCHKPGPSGGHGLPGRGKRAGRQVVHGDAPLTGAIVTKYQGHRTGGTLARGPNPAPHTPVCTHVHGAPTTWQPCSGDKHVGRGGLRGHRQPRAPGRKY